MLTAKLGDKILLGLDAENIKRLTAGQPILVPADRVGGDSEIIIAYAETLQELARDIGIPDAITKNLNHS